MDLSRQENLERLKKLGFEPDGQGGMRKLPDAATAAADPSGAQASASADPAAQASVVPSGEPAAQPSTEGTTPNPDPSSASAADPAPGTPAQANQPKHNWEKREEDAKAATALAQRQLSQARSELNQIQAELLTARQQLDQLRSAPTPSAPAQADAAPGKKSAVTLLKQEFPELAEAIDEVIEHGVRSKLDPLNSQLQELQNETKRTQAASSFEAVKNAVLKVHPDGPALTEDPSFFLWVNNKPKEMSDLYKKAAFENLAAFSPEFVIEMLDSYKRDSGLPIRSASSPAAASATPQTPRPSVAPSVSPAVTRGVVPGKPGSLTPEEIRQRKERMHEMTPAQRREFIEQIAGLALTSS